MIFTRCFASLALVALLASAASAQILIPQQAQILPPDPGIGDHFGLSVSADAGTIVVGPLAFLSRHRNKMRSSDVPSNWKSR